MHMTKKLGPKHVNMSIRILQRNVISVRNSNSCGQSHLLNKYRSCPVDRICVVVVVVKFRCSSALIMPKGVLN